MIERLKITTMYYKARFRYVAEKITNKLKLIRLISKCKNNEKLLIVHTFASELLK